MIPTRLLEQWKKDEAAPFKGWDFLYIKDRRIEEQPPWNYKALSKEFVKRSKAVLDMGTGGGEIFSTLAPFPARAVAIEGYKPNVKVAKERLEPLGAQVLEVDESYELPFADKEFDLILNRHSAFKASEVFRILRAGGRFLTQQVGGNDFFDLLEFFETKSKWPNHELEMVKRSLEDAGFKMERAEEWTGKTKFLDVGAVVYYLRAIPWDVDGFSVDSHLKYLERLQEKLERDGELKFTATRFLILARRE
ncbi:class I SAM-dependent methyltransferase [Candidatus Wolfebacteria bacterium]|nr:class I SAM-dependent methyltransferase [Candidatus Wolfebacteria bacterium]